MVPRKRLLMKSFKREKSSKIVLRIFEMKKKFWSLLSLFRLRHKESINRYNLNINKQDYK